MKKILKLREYQIRSIRESWESLLKNDDPVLLEMSVGAGKSYVIGSLAKRFEDANKRVLCLVNSSELVRNNYQAFKELGGSPSIFCASLNLKEYKNNIVFATPQSVISALNKNHPISAIVFNMIVVDEAHGINFHSDNSTFMRILRHYKQAYKPMRILGLTGTGFRGSESIVGKNALFKTQVGNISTKYLIDNGFLVKPVFGITESEGFDFSKCKLKNNGEFNGRDLQAVIDSKKRLTWEILQEVQHVMKNRDVCMVFCSTIPHCYEAMAALPEGQARMIIGKTEDLARNEALTLARQKKIKYLVSVGCLLTGVNVPAINLICFLRPTSSLLLYIQAIGRGLRLSEGKNDCVVLDFAGNAQRFQDIDDPIINEALQPKDPEDPDYCIPCLTCADKGIKTLNKLTSRRCMAVVNGKRCDHYFEWKDCPSCQNKTDITARNCCHCKAELIDPNAKLSLTAAKPELESFDVIQAKYWISDTNGHPVFNAMYATTKGINIFESFSIRDARMKNIFYGIFIRNQVKNASSYYPVLESILHLRKMISCGDVLTPYEIKCSIENNKYKIKKRLFHEEITTT